MAITIQGYKQRIDLGQGVNTPAVQPGVTRTGLGEAIQDLGDAGMRAVANYERSQKETAETESLAAASESRLALEQAYRSAQEQAEPGANQFTPRFQEYMDNVINDRANKLTSDEARKRYRERMIGVQNDMLPRAMTWEASERVAKRSKDFQVSADNSANAVYTVDGNARELTYRNLTADMESSLDNIGLPPSTREQLREEIKTKMSYAAVQGDLRDRPDKVQDWLVKGSGADYFSSLRSTESGGRNIGAEGSSAFGPYQFTRGTWSNLIKAHPELGLTEADRYKPEAQERAIRVFTADNAAALKKAGIEPTNTNLYMAHFLGSGGATQFIRAFKANPNDDARLHVAPASVAANPGVFRNGRTVGDVMALFGKKFGDKITWDKDIGTPAYYADIPFAKRDALYTNAETEMSKRRVQGEAAFNQRVQNSVGEFAASGVATSPPTENEFVAALGVQRGTVAYGEFTANANAAKASYQLQRMPLNEQPSFVESLKPKQGDPFFAEKQAGYEKVKVIADQYRERVVNDFGQHVVTTNPDARAALNDAFNPETDQAKAVEAAAQFTAIMDAEAKRLNVPASARALLPKSYSDLISSQLNQKLTADSNAYGAVAALNAYKERWGDAWPRVYREIKGQLSGPIQVITSGVQPKAATTLASVHDKSFEELSKTTMEPADREELTTTLQEAFQPFRNSSVWRPAGLPEEGIFFEQAKKLAAVYVAQGQDPEEAAESAYEHLIGFRYRMIDARGINVRVPKQFDTPDMEPLLRAEREDIINSDRIAPKGQAPRLRDSLMSEAKWVTLPNDKGVGLMYQGELRVDAKGQPIVKTWAELKASLDIRTAVEREENEAETQDERLIDRIIR